MWAQVICMLLGLWLMAAPAVLGYGRPESTSDRILGPIIASLAAVAIWEVARELRWLNLLFSIWLVLAPLVFSFESTAMVNSMAVGLAIAGLSLVRGKLSEDYGGGWSMLWRTS
jgi:fatty-acid desaturase